MKISFCRFDALTRPARDADQYRLGLPPELALLPRSTQHFQVLLRLTQRYPIAIKGTSPNSPPGARLRAARQSPRHPADAPRRGVGRVEIQRSVSTLHFRRSGGRTHSRYHPPRPATGRRQRHGSHPHLQSLWTPCTKQQDRQRALGAVGAEQSALLVCNDKRPASRDVVRHIDQRPLPRKHSSVAVGEQGTVDWPRNENQPRRTTADSPRFPSMVALRLN